MEIIRRKYLPRTLANDLDFLRSDFESKIDNFSLNHVLALKYLLLSYPDTVLTKDAVSNANFYVFLHFAGCDAIYSLVKRKLVNVAVLFVKTVVDNRQIFADAIERYKTLGYELLNDSVFLGFLPLRRLMRDLIPVSYDLGLNPLFHRGEPLRSIDLIYARLFKEATFLKVREPDVVRLLAWAYLSKRDSGEAFADNDDQSLYDVYQRTGHLVSSDLTESFREVVFPGTVSTSYWLWLRGNPFDDARYVMSARAQSFYEKLMSFIYDQLKLGRVNKNMLKAVYLFNGDPNVRNLMLELIYDVPGDILKIIDYEDSDWKNYFVSFYKKNFIDGKTFTSANSFYDDLFRVVAKIDPKYFADVDYEDLFRSPPDERLEFDDIKVNESVFSELVYARGDIDLYFIRNDPGCRIHSPENDYFIKEYNTYVSLNTEDRRVIDRGRFVPLEKIDVAGRPELFSLSLIKYHIFGRLANLGLVLADDEDLPAAVICRLQRVEDLSTFLLSVTKSDRTSVQQAARVIVNSSTFNTIPLFRTFLQENFDEVSEYLVKTTNFAAREKEFITRIIHHGRS
ncbi:ORF077 [Saltwater crocodilepox virus]|nr:hypothetical protein [Saltwater crocodilepox virus]AVD69412.1 hypothetical protein [Saltwater crocodilepox virus]QGT46516.1 ORF077 [Saltwater crocodilepox virus]QGT46732.1 ORF077 [Saltwater crocodilepox virus]QGT46948.1 ORF077 [Saltwater crocodilepox virus]